MPHPMVNVLMVHGSESVELSPGRVNTQTKGRVGGGAVSRVKRMPGRAGRQRVSGPTALRRCINDRGGGRLLL